MTERTVSRWTRRSTISSASSPGTGSSSLAGRRVVRLRPAGLPAEGVERDVLRDPGDPGLERVPAVEAVQALEDPDHRLLEGLVHVLLLRQEALTDVARQGSVPAVDLDEGLGVARLEVQNQESVVQGGIAARRLALVGNPDDHQSATHWNVCGGSRVARSARIVGASNTASSLTPRRRGLRDQPTIMRPGGLGTHAARSCVVQRGLQPRRSPAIRSGCRVARGRAAGRRARCRRPLYRTSA